MVSEQRSIFFPITADVPEKWPICLSRRAAHAWLAGTPGSEVGDKDEGFYIDADAPSSYMATTVISSNRCCQSQFMLVSVTKLSVLTIADSVDKSTE